MVLWLCIENILKKGYRCGNFTTDLNVNVFPIMLPYEQVFKTNTVKKSKLSCSVLFYYQMLRYLANYSKYLRYNI
jgi:hypothetical protein